MTITWR